MFASKQNGTLYTAVTSNLSQRIYQHKHDLTEGFTKKHCAHPLVYYELHETMETVITREKQVKKWKLAIDRKRKSRLERLSMKTTNKMATIPHSKTQYEQMPLVFAPHNLCLPIQYAPRSRP